MPHFRVLIAIAAGAGLLGGFALNAWLRSEPPEGVAAEPARAALEAGGADRFDAIEAEIAALKAALDDERSQRGALELEVAMLHQEAAGRAERWSVPEAAPKHAKQPAEGARAPEGGMPAHARPHRRQWFDEAALAEQGIDEQRATWLRERFEELQMEELYLRDEAARAGWLNTPRFREQLETLRGESREALGDDDYDLMLYATGQNNRVLLSDVLQNSPAASAGIEPGDIVLRYGERPIFKPKDLLEATSEGKPGATVPVDLLRDGRPLRLYVSRGPLGARIQGVRQLVSDGH